jgi:hypothetical protein
MPRKSPFSIVLSKEERIMLENQVRRYTSPYCDVIRAKIVLLAGRRPLQRLSSLLAWTPRCSGEASRPRDTLVRERVSADKVGAVCLGHVVSHRTLAAKYSRSELR